ncbi:thiosulfate sulfurtransferase [Photobacterium proteolyticum]|uniref:Thiosulfate sulfurtransferase n=1 Tax=Photobacterium proteolyticum TaxID=1903952 RepID=A0A1Q9GKA7_9GAMM|nr:thiosulfate sulfurtransferase [Photobacterium proteolyticum]
MFSVRRLLFPLITLVSTPLMATTFDELAKLPPSDIQVIDCRSSNNYNGWPEASQTRGGHFPGAINFDSDWLSTLRPPHLEQLLQSKGIELTKPTFLYCEPEKANVLLKQLDSIGINNVSTISQKISDYSGQLDHLAKFEKLVTPQWLKQVIDGEQALYAPEKGFKVVEVAWGPPTKYLAAHIPGSLYLNTNNIESEPWWNRVDDQKLAETIKQLGIRFDTTVVLYGRDNTAAARAASILMYAGVDDVRLLNGGWKSWVNAGYRTEPMLNKAPKHVDFGRPIPSRPELIIDVPEARAILDDPEHKSLVSIRSWEEYIGNTSGYKYIKPKGRITGSKWGHAGSDAYHLEDFRNPDDTMISADIIEAFWKDWGINELQKVSFYCGTGWRASETFFYAYVMGWEDISVFDGGWFEWSGDPANPSSKGDVAPDHS